MCMAIGRIAESGTLVGLWLEEGVLRVGLW